MKTLAMTAILSAIFQVGEIPLEVRDLVHDSGTIDFRLYNVSDKPITAWRLEITTVINGELSGMTMVQDFFISTEVQQDKTGADGHLLGELIPNDYHHHILPYGQPLESVEIRPTAIVFDDLSYLGEPEAIERIFRSRGESKVEIRRWLAVLLGIQAESKGRERTIKAMEDLARTLEDIVGENGSSTRLRIAHRGDGVKSDLLSALRYALATVEDGSKDSNSALDLVTKIINRQYAAALKHTPEQ